MKYAPVAVGLVGLAFALRLFWRSSVVARSKVRPLPPSIVNVPGGWRRLKDSEPVTPAMTVFAKQVKSEDRPLGDLQLANIEGKLVGGLTEWHYDDHQSPGKEIWHSGVSIVVPV